MSFSARRAEALKGRGRRLQPPLTVSGALGVEGEVKGVLVRLVLRLERDEVSL
jgi:hypothetical protein